MRGRKGRWVLALALSVGLAVVAGCEVTSKHAIQVRQPAQTPQPSLASVGALPFPAQTPDLQPLVYGARPAVDVLIDEVQAKFDAGERAYHAGQLDVARRDFNAALDHLMKSGLEVTGDARLQQLFNHIVDTMQGYELEAEKNDEAAAGPGEENAGVTDETQPPVASESTAPIEEIANMESLPATDPRLAAMAEKELIDVPHDLPLTVNKSVLQYLSFFESPRGREIVEAGLERAGRYRAMIESTLKQEGLPLDLIYLAQAESAFKTKAVSSAGARGIWQFMPYSGEEYGLKRNFWVDEREDPEAATLAAAETFRDLYQMFGDWYLVMAAYNSGPLNVARAVERTGYADFWKLQKLNALPLQTKNYVPIILALAMVAKDPALYGIHVDPDPPLEFGTVKLNHPISLRLVADATDSSIEDLETLNPELIRGVTPAGVDFALRVPPGTGAQLKKEIAAIPADKRTSWRLAKFEAGETMGEIARRYHVTLTALENVNVIDANDPPAAGAELIVPAAPSTLRHWVVYRIHPADTVGGIARRFHVSVWELREWNHIRGNTIFAGHLLRIYEAGYGYASDEYRERAMPRRRIGERSAAPVRTAFHGGSSEHRVRNGDTLWSIARAYHTTVAALRRENPFLARHELKAGEIIKVGTVR